MAKWLDYAEIGGGTVADADILPFADMSETENTRQRIITVESMRTILSGASPIALAPTVNDDSGDGYRVGSIVVTPAGALYVCTDASLGAAAWTQFGSGAGDVVGPASVVDDRIATFDGTTGKLIQDGGVTVAGLATAAQGALADSAVQPDDPISINAQTGTTYTLVLADLGKLVTLSNAAAITLTVPTNASVAFPVGTVIACAQIGAGLVSIAGDTGVTINGAAPGAEASSGQYATWSLTKLATDTWLASGGLA